MKIKLLKSKKGEGYIDLIISLGVIFTVIYTFILIFPIFIAKQNIDYMAKSLVKTIEITGELDEKYYDSLEYLKKETGLNPEITLKGNFKEGKLQLRDKFTLEIKDSVDIVVISGIFGKDIKISVPVSKRLSGLSEVYFK